MIKEAQEILISLRDLLLSQGEHGYAELLNGVIGGSEEKIWSLLESNIVWGGAGSIADQACISGEEEQKKFYELMVKLANLQDKAGRLNERTMMWAAAFRSWNEKNII
jgi:hypothetical protein